MSFGKRLKKLRREKKLTQKELANILDTGESTISFYEHNKRKPDYDMLDKIAGYFNVSVDYLLCRTNNQNEVIYEEFSENGYVKEERAKEKEIKNPDIRSIARAGNKMTDEQAAELKNLAERLFPDAFKEDN